MAASELSLKLKLLVDTRSNRVLFAEASKDFVDFLFYLLSLPVGTVIKLLSSKRMVGSLGNLYESIENLSETYIQANKNKNSVLNPKSSLSASILPLLLPESRRSEIETGKFFTCNINRSSLNHYNVTDDPNRVCPSCGVHMNRAMSYIPSDSANKVKAVDGGFVKEVVTYMVMDNLEVMPMSTISSITMLNKLNVKDVGALKERVVNFGCNEGLKLLKVSLECKNVLTSVFIGNN